MIGPVTITELDQVQMEELAAAAIFDADLVPVDEEDAADLGRRVVNRLLAYLMDLED